MKKITYLKLSMDILMLLVFALLFNTRVFSGLEFHEIAGLCLGVIFVVHLMLNGRWLKKVTTNILSPKISRKTRIGYIVNILLLLSMSFILVSGIMISKTILVGVLKASDTHLFQSLHIAVSYASLLLTSIFNVLITHLGIISAFSVMTFYALKLVNRKNSGISIT